MLALSRHLPGQLRNQEKRIWGDGWTSSHTPTLLQGKTVGIFGVGLIAEALAPKCKALGMRVVGISRTPRDLAGFDEIRPRDQLLDIVPQLDYLLALLPGSPDNNQAVSAGVFAAMKPSAFFINVARGSVVDEDALIDALQTGRIAGAALDVFAREPLPADSPLWGMENVIITPHRAGLSDVYTDLAMPIIEENIRRFLAGDIAHMINVINH
jgi:phosphoglycerate dehydrogenase-like enzyme